MNNIPAKIRKELVQRSGYQCEICGSINVDGIHHIIPRRKRIHRIETLIHLCVREHNDSLVEKMLQIGLQNYYYNQGFNEKKVRELMGGRLYTWEVNPTQLIKNHFRRLLYDEMEQQGSDRVSGTM